MASIDWGTIAIGALIGVGCKKQLRAATRIAASTAASLSQAAAQAVSEVAKETSKSPEEKAAEAFLQRVDQQIAGQAPQANGKNG